MRRLRLRLVDLYVSPAPLDLCASNPPQHLYLCLQTRRPVTMRYQSMPNFPPAISLITVSKRSTILSRRLRPLTPLVSGLP